MLGSKDPDLETPGSGPVAHASASRASSRACSRCPDGSLRILVQAGQRVRIDEWIGEEPYLVARVSEIPDEVDEGPGADRADAQRPADVHAHHRGGPVPPRGAPDGGGEPRGALRAQPPDRRRAADQGRGEAGAARGGRRLQAPEASLRDPRPRARHRRHRLEDPVAGDVGDGELAARVRAPAAAEGDPGGAGGEGPGRGRGRRAARATRRDRTPRGRPQAGRPRALPAREAAAGGRRARRHPHLPGVDRVAAVGQAHRRQPRPRPRAGSPRRRPLRHRQGQGADPRVPGRAQAQAGRHRLVDHVLRRPARRRQDVAGPLDRALDGPEVRAHQRRRRPRRGRDPRPPPHLHRRDARDDHPRAPRRRREQPAVHDRRDRQDGRGLPRRPGLGDARGARPRAELDVPRSLPRRAVRPLARPVHHDREHARHDPAAAARPDGDHPARRLHRGGEAPDRQALPGAAAGGPIRTQALADRLHRRRA